jgi:integrase/recombinase XerC
MNGLSCFQFPMRRASRFPRAEKRTASTGSGFSRWSPQSPLFIGRDGERITRGTLQSRIKRAFRRAGPEEQPVPGALVHGLRHTSARNTSANDRSASAGLYLMSAPAANAFSDPMMTITPIKGSESNSAAAVVTSVITSLFRSAARVDGFSPIYRHSPTRPS